MLTGNRLKLVTYMHEQDLRILCNRKENHSVNPPVFLKDNRVLTTSVDYPTFKELLKLKVFNEQPLDEYNTLYEVKSLRWLKSVDESYLEVKPFTKSAFTPIQLDFLIKLSNYDIPKYQSRNFSLIKTDKGYLLENDNVGIRETVSVKTFDSLVKKKALKIVNNNRTRRPYVQLTREAILFLL